MDKTKLKSLLSTVDATIKQAMKQLSDGGGKILFVVDKNEKLIGTVTDGDIRRGIIKGYGFSERIESLMKREFLSIKVDMQDKEEYVKSLMLKTKIEQIPVLDGNGIIVDVILWTDILAGKKQLRANKLHSNRIVIMAGGKGTRLDPFTKIFPKPLIPIGNKPVIEIIMERFFQYGFHKFIYTLNYKKEYLKLFLKENNFPYDIDWVEEDDFLGTAGSLSLLKDKITETFFVANCDSLLDVNFQEILDWHREHEATMTIIGCHNEVKIPFGVLQLSNGKLEKIIEKPLHDVIINTGIYVMEPRMLSYLVNGVTMDMNELIDVTKEKEKITVYPIYGGWLDIGRWDEYKKSIEKLEGIVSV
ncbi:MAG TPA: nucleotidyl transferase [Ignavibacteriales bacterium]|nr:nucleotidyl transferase [Ignavibacteriales bacterium]